MIDPKLFTVERLLWVMLNPDGNGHYWRAQAEIITDYMPPHPRPETRPTCVVRFGKSFLRHSCGPRQGHFWDIYGDDYQSPELALLALASAPVPTSILTKEHWLQVASERKDV